MRQCFIIFFSFIVFYATPVFAEDYVINASQSENAFEELSKACTKVETELWGVEICGATLFVDPQTRQVVANQAASYLISSGSVWRGQLPNDLPIANTSITWGDKEWALIMWPLPEDKNARLSLMIHENWHNIQNQLDFVPTSQTLPNHLDGQLGRTYMRMELIALERALATKGDSSHTHALSAAWYRVQRQSIDASAELSERSFELTEGLAEYTGKKLAGYENLYYSLEMRMAQGERLESFTRAFAYYTGPAWGVLLDRVSDNWRSQLDGTKDLAQVYLLLSQSSPTLGAFDYQFEKVEQEEQEREVATRKKIQLLQARFVEGSKLILPQGGGNMSFNPMTTTSLGDHGTVYETMTLTAPWGKIEATNGLLISSDWRHATVDWQGQALSSEVIGNGWTLTLNEDWQLVRQDDGNITVEKN